MPTMSYQPRIGTPLLMVIGRTGACGNTKRSAGQCGRVGQHATPRGAHQRATQRAVLVLHDRFQPPHGLDKALL
ncbi:hypothetical protein G6F32_017465 [Rhizopus arrhizus]|nr:hypothetical protein G6F32_017465 [Rhizopus arrhizus]